MNTPLNQLKRSELLKLCRSRDLHNYSRLPKKDLLCLLAIEPPADPPQPPTEPHTDPPQPHTKRYFLSIASAILRHYYMYPILTAALFNSYCTLAVTQ